MIPKGNDQIKEEEQCHIKIRSATINCLQKQNFIDMEIGYGSGTSHYYGLAV
jgi:hypothetical protein